MILTINPPFFPGETAKRQATEASRLHRCLEGHDVALSQKAVALHIFRQAVPMGSSAMGLPSGNLT
jgi:hypothetical protein